MSMGNYMVKRSIDWARIASIVEFSTPAEASRERQSRSGWHTHWLGLFLIVGATLVGLFASDVSAQQGPDRVPVTVSPTSVTILEGGPAQDITLTIPANSGTRERKFYYTFIPSIDITETYGSAGIYGQDFTAKVGGNTVVRQGTITLSGSSEEARTATISLEAIWDGIAEKPERFAIDFQPFNFSDPEVSFPNNKITVTITNRPLPVNVANDRGKEDWDDGATEAAKKDGKVVFRVELPTAPQGAAQTVNYAITPDAPPDFSNAASAGDYTPPAGGASGTLSFLDTKVQEIVVTPVDDNLVEGVEAFTLTLSNPSGNLEFPDQDGDGTPDTTLKAYGFIESEDTVDVTIRGGTVAEGEAARLPVTLARALRPGEHASILAEVVEPTGSHCAGGEKQAVEHVDYRAVNSQRFTFGPGDQTRHFEVYTRRDVLDENDECILVLYGNAEGLRAVDADGGQPIVETDADGNEHRYFLKELTITDDDDPPIVSVTSSTVREPDEGETAKLTYVVRLDRSSGRTVKVNYARISRAGTGLPDQATSGTDYEALSSGTLTFLPGETRKKVEVTVKGDYEKEPDEVVWISFTNAVNACFRGVPSCGGGGLISRGIILNDDDPVELTVAVDDATVLEGVSAVVRLTLSRPVPYDLSANFKTKDITATGGVDYRDLSGTAFWIHVPKGQTTGRKAIGVHDDGISGEGLETFTLEFEAGASLFLLGVAPENERVRKQLFGVNYEYADLAASVSMPTITIVDRPGLSLTVLEDKVTEGQPAHVRATLSDPSATDVTFTWKTQDGGNGADDAHTAKAGKDYTARTMQSATIPAGETSIDLPAVQTLQDTIDEGDQYFTVTVVSVTSALPDDADAVVTVRDDDSRPWMSIGDAEAVEGGSLEFTISLDAASERPVSVIWVTEDDTASVLDNDYVGVTARQTVTFAPGELSKTIVVDSQPDIEPEVDEQFRIQLAHAPHAKFRDPTAVGTIKNDDTMQVAIADAAPVTEGPGATADFVISLKPAQTSAVTVRWATSDGASGPLHSARSGGNGNQGENDFTAASGSVTFAAGETEKTVSVTVNDDDFIENTEEFRVTISGDEASIDFSNVVGYAEIEDDDALTWEIVGVLPAALPEGTTADWDDDTIYQVKIRRTAHPDEVNFPWDEFGFQVCALTRPNPRNFPGGATPRGLTVGAAGSTDVSVGKIANGEFRASLVECHERTRIGELAEIHTVQFGGTLREITFGVRPRGDSLAEGNETLSLWLYPFVGRGWSLFSPDARLGLVLTTTIIDDERPQASVSGPASVNEDAGRARFTVSLSKPHTQALEVFVDVRNGTAIAGEDYQPVREKITFAPGETAQTVEVVIFEDGRNEPVPETFTVFLEEASAGLNIHPVEGEATVEINDSTQTDLYIPDRVVDEGETVDILFNSSNPLTRLVTGLVYLTTAGVSNPAADDDVDYTGWERGRRITGYGSYPSRTVLILSGTQSWKLPVPTTEDSRVEADEDLGVLFNIASVNPPQPRYRGYFPVGGNQSYRMPRITIRNDDLGSVAVGGYSDAERLEGLDWESPVPTVSGAPLGHVTWTLEGDDDARFTIDADTGVISLPAQDFDDPKDQNTDNVYQVTARATDEDGNSDTQAVRVTVTSFPIASVAAPAAAVAEGDDPTKTTALNFPVSLSAARNSDATLTYTLGGTATGGTAEEVSDYTTPDPLEVTIPAGSTTANIVIPVKGDVVDEDDETVTVTLTGAVNAELSATAADLTATGTITDDDAPPTLSVADAEAPEGSKVAFEVTLSAASEQAVTFKWGTSDDATGANPATAGTDYTAVTTLQTVTIMAGSTTATLEVETAQDTMDEEDETFLVRLSSPTDATISDGEGEGTITDGFQITGDTSFEATENVAWSSPGDSFVIYGNPHDDVTWTLTGDDADLFTVVSISSSLSVQAQIDLPAQDFEDPKDKDGDNVYEVTLVATDTKGLSAATDVQVTVTNVSIGGVVFDPRTAVDEGNAVSFTVRVFSLIEDSTPEKITLEWNTAADADGDHPADAGDYTPVTVQTIGWPGSRGLEDVVETITVQTTQDALDEFDETFLIELNAIAKHPVHPHEVEFTILGNRDVVKLGPNATASVTATIVDNDAPPTLSVADAGASEGSKAEFTVSLSAVSGKDVTFKWKTAADADGDHPAGATDYTAVSTLQTVTIAAGERSATIEVQTTADNLTEPDETFLVQLSSPTNATLDDAEAVGTISDRFSLDGKASYQVQENIAWSADFTVAGSPTGAIAWTLSGDDADLFAVTVTSTANPDVTKAQLSLAAQDYEDPKDEDGGNVYEVTLVATDESGLASRLNVEVTVTDVIRAAIVIHPVKPVDEGDPVTFKVQIQHINFGSPMEGDDVTLEWNTAVDADGDHPAGASDYTPVTTGTITWATDYAGPDIDKSITVQTVQDAIDEHDETFLIELNASVGNSIHSDEVHFHITDDGTDYATRGLDPRVTVTATIKDDDAATAVVSVGAPGAAVIEGDDPTKTTNMSFPVSLSAASGKVVTVTYTLTGTARAPGDYTEPDPLSVSVPAGSTTANIVIPIRGDVLYEDDETVIVTLTGATNAALDEDASDLTATGTITDDDETIELSIADLTVAEGKTMVFTVSISRIAPTDVFVGWRTSPDSTGDHPAEQQKDFVYDTGIVRIKAGNTSGRLAVRTVGDTLDEHDETFLIKLSQPRNATIVDGQATGTITDDDDAPTLSVNDVSVAEGGLAEFTATLSAASGKAVFFKWKTAADADGTHAAGASDYTAVAETDATIAAGFKTVKLKVQTVQDTLGEEDETFLVQLSAAANATIADAEGQGTITDNDDAPVDDDAPTVSVAAPGAAVPEGDDPTKTTDMSFPVSLTAASGKDVTVTYVLGGSASPGSDYIKSDPLSVTIAAGATTANIVVPIKGDMLDEDDEYIIVTLTGATNAKLPDTPSQKAAIGDITDDDGTPTLSVNDASVTEGGTAAFTVTLSAASGKAVTCSRSPRPGAPPRCCPPPSSTRSSPPCPRPPTASP